MSVARALEIVAAVVLFASCAVPVAAIAAYVRRSSAGRPVGSLAVHCAARLVIGILGGLLFLSVLQGNVLWGVFVGALVLDAVVLMLVRQRQRLLNRSRLRLP